MSARSIDTVELKEVMSGSSGVDENKTTKVKVSLENDGLALLVHPEGYGVWDGEYAPILIEQHEGKMRLIVWGDINDEEPTHIIDLEGARETDRIPCEDYSFNK